MGNIVTSAAFLPPYPSYDKNYPGLFMIKDRVPAVFTHCFRENPQVSIMQFPTLIFTHGNAEDLGQSENYLSGLGQAFRFNLLIYDYAGYGMHADREPSEKKCYQDISDVYEHAIKELKIPSTNIVLWGRSLGSGPTVDLGSRLYSKNKSKGRPLAGLMLTSPIESAIRVVSNTLSYSGLDIFQNYAKIHKVRCPIFIAHGDNDEVVPYAHGQTLFKKSKSEFAYKFVSVKGAGHNDMDGHEEYIKAFEEYIQFIIGLIREQKSQNDNEDQNDENDDDKGTSFTTSLKRT